MADVRFRPATVACRSTPVQRLKVASSVCRELTAQPPGRRELASGGGSLRLRALGQTLRMPYEEDFAPDAAGLREAMRVLVELRTRPGSPHVDPQAPLERLPEALPEHGVGALLALERLAGPALGQVSRLDHPGFFAHMDPPTPWMTWVAAAWAAAVNQNLLHPDTAPAARQLEQLVINWMAPAFGMGGGHMLPGSTLANLTGLWAGRELTGARRVVASAAAHVYSSPEPSPPAP